MNRLRAVVIAGGLLMGGSAVAVEHAVNVGIGVSQIKEGENLGMVFTGPKVQAGYALRKDWGRWAVDYQAEVTAAGVFTRGMTGYEIGFTPAEAGTWCRVLDCLQVGAGTGLKYHWQMYPDLHNSQLFAQVEIPLELRLRYEMDICGNQLALTLKSSIFGFVGSLPMHDPYFYSLSFEDFAFKPFRNMKFASFGEYDHTCGQITWTPARMPRHSFGLQADYLKIKSFESLNFALTWSKKF